MLGNASSITQQSFFTSGTERLVITSGGNVGIGVSPGTRLNVKEENSGTEGFIVTNWNGVNTVLAGSDSISGGGKFTLKTNGGTSAVFISSTASSYFNGGSVGVGTSSPGAKLEISEAAGVANFAALKLTNTTGSGNANVDLNMSAAGNAGGVKLRAIAPGSNHNDLAMYVTNAGTLQATPAIFIQGSTNRVGVNRSDPSYNLDISGNVRTTDWYYVETSGRGLYNNANSMWWASHESGSYSLSSNTTFSGIKLFSGGSQNTFRGYFYGDSSGQGFLDSGGNWQLIVDSSSRLRVYAGVYNIEGTTVRVLNPGGAALNDPAAPVTGAFKIKLPVAAYNSNTMMTLVVDIYNYDTGKSLRFRIGGYNYQDGSWYNTFAEQTSDLGVAAYNVRFGNDGTSNCIWIGETNSTWQYPKVFVSQFLGAHAATTSAWASGWTISRVTSFDTVTATRNASVGINNNNIGTYGVSSITGTANQVTASASTGAVTLSLPQNIHTAATPTFSSLTLSGDVLTLSGSGVTAYATNAARIYNQSGVGVTVNTNTFEVRTGTSNASLALSVSNTQNTTLAGNLTVSGTGTSSVAGSVNVDGGINFLRGSGEYSTYIKANDYIDGGYNGSTLRYWIELGSKGGTHIVLNTDGSAAAAENSYDHFTIWQAVNGTGAIAAGARKFWITNTGRVNFIDSTWHKSSDGIERIHFGSSGSTFYKGGGTGNIHTFRNASDADILTLNNAKDATFTGDATFNKNGNIQVTLSTASTTAGATNRLRFITPASTADVRSGVIEWYKDGSTFMGDLRFKVAGGIEIRNSADQLSFTTDDSKNATVYGNVSVAGDVQVGTSAGGLKAYRIYGWSGSGAGTAGTLDIQPYGNKTTIGGIFEVSGASSFFSSVTISGNLTVNGTTTTVNSTVSTIKDPVITLGGGNAGTAASSDDNKDRGIEFKWHNGTAAKTGFFGFDDSTGYFTFIPDATNTSEVFSGTQGDIQATNFRGALIGNVTGTASGNLALTGGTLSGKVTWATNMPNQKRILGIYETGNIFTGIGMAATTASPLIIGDPGVNVLTDFGYLSNDGSYTWNSVFTVEKAVIRKTNVGAVQFVLNSTDSSSKEIVFQNNGSTAGYVWHASTYVAMGGGNVNNSLFVNGGYVGIGVIGTATKLEVYDSTNAVTAIRVNNPNTGTAAHSSIQFANANSTNGAGVLLFGSGYTTSGLYRQDGMYIYTNRGGGITLNVETNNPMYFATSNTERMRIDGSGNVGVGTGSGAVDFKTTIAADITMSGDVNPGTAQLSVQGSTTPGKRMLLGYDTTGNGYGFIKAGNFGVTWTTLSLQPSGGNVSIGTTSNSYKLHVAGDIYASSGYIRVNSTNAFYFETYGGGWYMEDTSWIRTVNAKNIWTSTGLLGSNGGLTVGYGGNAPNTTYGAIIAGSVGIGTASPSAKLHVSGGRTYLASSDGYELAFARSGSYFYFYNDGNGSTGKLSLTDTAGIGNHIITFTQDTRNVGIGTTSPGYKLEVNGSFAATTKSFVIKHPTKPGKKLRYGSLEGPENGVYVRGKLKGSNIIELPDYWTKLVDPESITVQLTPIGSHQKLYIEKIEGNKVYIVNENLLAKAINCFFYVLAERCDVEKLEVEIDA
jgi:hypothetical protein